MSKKFLPIPQITRSARYLVMTLLALSVVLAPQTASAQSPADPVDQQQELSHADHLIDQSDGGYDEPSARAQSFIPTVDNLSGVTLRLSNGGEVRVSITAGNPNDSAHPLATTVVSAPASETEVFVPFPPPPSLLPGTTYSIKVAVISGKPGFWYVGVPGSDAYENGQRWDLYGDLWYPEEGTDFFFRTHFVPSDTDGDGVNDDVDNCPNDANPGQQDFDGDGAGDLCDPDDDNDGVADVNDAFPFNSSEWADTDGDGIGDNADTDDDNDGQSDADETACGSNPLDANSTAPDFDGDSSPDCIDPDDDNDGVDDLNDAFPFDPSESSDNDGDGIGDNADPDDDNDGQSDADEMACGSNPVDANSTAPDFDGDSSPDCVDPDDDNDGVDDVSDAFPFDPSEWADTDSDGIGDNADPDDDNDGQSDADEVACGSDPLDANSTAPDFDGDSSPDCVDPDDDNDGVDDVDDLCAETVLPEARPPQSKKNRFYANADGQFIDGVGNLAGYSVVDTGGCSGIQIIDAMGLGNGHRRQGITRGVLKKWIAANGTTSATGRSRKALVAKDDQQYADGMVPQLFLPLVATQ